MTPLCACAIFFNLNSSLNSSLLFVRGTFSRWYHASAAMIPSVMEEPIQNASCLRTGWMIGVIVIVSCVCVVESVADGGEVR